ncbi:PQQ-dependent sugar dehydrogenase [Marinimicrococcus flavescens]|uniref:PQQ-dependent sugar dehydrogenase n=1 Tax=Marinimicrococcus flavescens TaxID=3031815 RepID=A0AAP3XTG7_9PROT|nr:PQQ-dependent sugar dehydrogenase [Marinimicrococcus flavescens]
MRINRLMSGLLLGASIGFNTSCGSLGWWGTTGLARAGDAETLVQAGGQQLHLVPVVEGLEFPWSLAFLPDGRMLVTEREGRLRLVEDGRLMAEPVAGLPEVVARGQGGLLDVALHPRFAENGWLYLTYSGPGSDGLATHLMRARLRGDALEEQEVIFVAEPGSGTGRHFGSRIVFGRDGLLHMSIGDRGEMQRAQDLSDLAGKIVRLRDDGSIPADNPFTGRADAHPAILAYGVRNPQGLALHPVTGELWEQEHGPRGGDEVNIIRKGANYGWPLTTHGIDYSGLPIGRGRTMEGVEPPLWTWVPSVAPSGMAFYTGAAIPAWQGDLLVGALKDRMLVRLDLEGERIVGEERLLEDAIGRIRDVRVGPDGLVYLLNDEADGGIWRLEPADG